MATFNFFVSASKRESAPIYIRVLSGSKVKAMELIDPLTGEMECKVCKERHFAILKTDGKHFVRGSWECKNHCQPSTKWVDLVGNTLLSVNPEQWSNKTQKFKQRILSDADNILIEKLKHLKDFIEKEYWDYFQNYTKEWLTEVIYRFHHKKEIKAKSLNSYIDEFIKEAETGAKKNKETMNFAPGTVRIFKGFQRIFNEYQGTYTPKRIEWHKERNKKLRPIRKLDFENINIDFYNSFIAFLSDEGYAKNTMGRFIKSLKLIMRNSLEAKLHSNTEYTYKAFATISESSFSVYLTKEELDKIYNYDLSKEPRLELARDAFMVLCETALRISDYKKIEISIRTIEGRKFIDIIQSKTGEKVIIPLTPRFHAIWKKYGNALPQIPEQYVNKYIKSICFRCDIDETLTWEGKKYGKKFEKTAKKWELISCHTGRRTACTNMYLAKIPLVHIRAISGHKSDKQLLDYVKASKEETALIMADYDYFTGNNLSIAK